MNTRGTIALMIAAALLGFALGSGRPASDEGKGHRPTKAPPQAERSVVTPPSAAPEREDARPTGTDAPAPKAKQTPPAKWFRDRAEAERVAKEIDGLVFELHTAPQCVPCERLKAYLKTPRFGAIQRRHRLVLLWTSGDFPAPRSYVNRPGEAKHPGLVGYSDPDSFEAWLDRRLSQLEARV